MKNLVLSLILGFFSVGFAQAQQTSTPPSKESIEMKLKFLGYRFYQDGERLSWKELVDATERAEEANLLIKKAKTQRLISNLMAGVGGFITGIPIGQSIRDDNPNWELAYIGGALFIVSLPISLKAFNNVNKGVDTYNIAVAPSAGYHFQPEVFVINNQNGFGVSLRF
ncbi:hypothetical protein [Allomuricauda sp. M10]|uniref:hypothetical protein n=1 Tax=Allomuricauda sp. M10 TaxID=2683292 RepID=UPI001D197E7B|nr:hypothetical protein [Muricauda sp. M10]